MTEKFCVYALEDYRYALRNSSGVNRKINLTFFVQNRLERKSMNHSLS